MKKFFKNSKTETPVNPDADNKNQDDEEYNNYISYGLCLGVALGVSLGLSLFDNLALGIGVGMGLGVAIGGVLAEKKKKEKAKMQDEILDIRITDQEDEEKNQE